MATNYFFFNFFLIFFKMFWFVEEQKKTNLLVLPIEDISLQPEFSSPPRFRIHGGVP